MTIYGYVRVSTLDQASMDRSSLADQERIVRAAASLVTEEPVFLFSDPGVSGSIPINDRPAGRELMERVQDGDTIIAAKLDRMFRSAKDALIMVDALRDRGVKVILCDISASDPVNSNGVGGLFFKILAAVADFERERINDRTRMGRVGKKARGGHIGGDAPYGFRKIGSGKDAVLERHPDEHQVVDLIRTLRRDSWSLYRIANELNRNGKVAREGLWSAKQISRVLERAA